MACECKDHENRSNMVDQFGRCYGHCKECGAHLVSSGRYTVYCPDCDVCLDCGCPQVDGNMHYSGCAELELPEEEFFEDEVYDPSDYYRDGFYWGECDF